MADGGNGKPALVEELYIGVVTGGDEVLWVGAAVTRGGLAEALADFLLPRCLFQLGEVDSREFRRLLAQGEQQRAVDHYFESVDDRWERERLVVVERNLGGATGGGPAVPLAVEAG